MSYDINSIESLTFTQGIRQRIQMYLGSSNVEGIWQGLKEIINNSTDEALGGYGDKIIITIDEEKQIFSVRDFGRSVPYGIRDNGENVLVSIFSKAHTGGKFDHKSYAQSVGYNGIGASATCLSAEYFIVKSFRNNCMGMARWDKGENTEYKEEENIKEPTGTYIEYKPDEEVFKDAEEKLSFTRILSEIENISYLNSKVRFIVINKNTNERKEFYSENGIVDFINSKIKKPLMNKSILCTKSDENDTVEVAFMWTKDATQFHVFVNGGYCNEGGAPVTGIKTTLTNFMKKEINNTISPDLIRRGLVCAINCKVMNPSFEGQTKNKINNPNLKSLASAAMKEGLEEFKYTSDFAGIVEMMKQIQKAEKAADKAREAVLNHNKEMAAIKKTKLAFINKLSDAEDLGQEAILCITEGDSAGSSVALGRDTHTHGILRIKGKMINSLKAEDEKVYQNEEIKLLLYALGIDIDNYNSNKLRYGKIAMCVDQDK